MAQYESIVREVVQGALSDSEVALLRQRYPAWAGQLDANAMGLAMLVALNEASAEKYRLRHLKTPLFTCSAMQEHPYIVIHRNPT